MDTSWKIFILPPILALITSVTIFGNFFVLLDFFTRLYKTPQTVSPTHYFIANLATADFLVGLVVLPFLGVLQVTGQWEFGPFWCSAWTFLHFMLCAASILSTCFVCVDRYIGVKYPFRHGELFRGWRVWAVLLGIWVIAGTPAALRVFLWSLEREGNNMGQDWGHCDLKQRVEITVLSCVVVLYIPLAIMVVLYSKIYFIAKEHIKKQKGRKLLLENNESTSNGRTDSTGEITRKNSSASISISEVSRNSCTRDGAGQVNEEKAPKRNLTLEERQVRLAKRLFFLVGILVVSYFPYFTLILGRSIYPEIVSGEIFRAFAWLRYFNSFLNPFIYAYAMPTYRKNFRKSVSRVTRRWNRRTLHIPPVAMSALK